MQCKEPWKNVSYKIKGYFRYKTITTQKVSFEAQVQIFFILSKVMFRSQDIQVFVYLTIPWLTKSILSWWVLLPKTGCIFEHILWTATC